MAFSKVDFISFRHKLFGQNSSVAMVSLLNLIVAKEFFFKSL